MTGWAIGFFGAIILGGLLFLAFLGAFSGGGRAQRMGFTVQVVESESEARLVAARRGMPWHLKRYGSPDSIYEGETVENDVVVPARYWIYEPEGVMVIFTRATADGTGWKWSSYAIRNERLEALARRVSDAWFEMRMAERRALMSGDE
jgi:hypothetical protein